MLHHVARGHESQDLFVTWEEAHALWERTVRAAPDLVALFLMPNHLHLLARSDRTVALRQAAGGYALWRNARRGERGPVFDRLPPPTFAEGRQKERRDERYIHLQACRARLRRCPLAWPFSTHRDAVGLAVRPVRPAAADPVDYHRWVSGDPTAAVQGTSLPFADRVDLRGSNGVIEVGDAVTEALRVPWSHLRRRGPARALWLRASLALVPASPRELAEAMGVSVRTIHDTRSRHGARPDPGVDLTARLLGDPRFPGLRDGPGALR